MNESEDHLKDAEKATPIRPLVEYHFSVPFKIEEMFNTVREPEHKPRWEISGFTGRYLVLVDWREGTQIYAMPRDFVKALEAQSLKELREEIAGKLDTILNEASSEKRAGKERDELVRGIIFLASELMGQSPVMESETKQKPTEDTPT